MFGSIVKISLTSKEQTFIIPYMTKKRSYSEELCKRVYKEGGNITEWLVKFEPYKAQETHCWSVLPSLQPPLILQLQI